MTRIFTSVRFFQDQTEMSCENGTQKIFGDLHDLEILVRRSIIFIVFHKFSKKMMFLLH